jgi:hypothetical protein
MIAHAVTMSPLLDKVLGSFTVWRGNVRGGGPVKGPLLTNGWRPDRRNGLRRACQDGLAYGMLPHRDAIGALPGAVGVSPVDGR